MKIVLTTLNARFSHSSLALAYLSASCSKAEINHIVKEYAINDNQANIRSELYRLKPDIICFSCYIWNISQIIKLAADLHKLLPHCGIIMGGPEASNDAVNLLAKHDYIELIVKGEGELILPELIKSWDDRQSWSKIPGIVFRGNNGEIINTLAGSVLELDSLPDPYRNDLDYYRNRIIYFETSRGCPYNCTYCLSATSKGVRYFSLDRVKTRLEQIAATNPQAVKFVDRTFNSNENRALEIMRFLLEQDVDTIFHFEIAAEYLSSGFLEFLKTVPGHRFNFEIGIQSTNPVSLSAINRKCNWNKLRDNIEFLRKNTKIHIHLDLIVGLPFEDYSSIKNSFNDTLLLLPQVVQLGFLKLLPGSIIREEHRDHGFLWEDSPPYQILANAYLSADEIISLQYMETILDNYYNSHLMDNTIQYLIANVYNNDPFSFFEQLTMYWLEQGYINKQQQSKQLYTILKNFVSANSSLHCEACNELLKYDYLVMHRSRLVPDGIDRHNEQDAHLLLFDCIKDSSFRSNNLAELEELSKHELRRRLHLEYFSYYPGCKQKESALTPILFVYSQPASQRADKVIVF